MVGDWRLSNVSSLVFVDVFVLLVVRCVFLVRGLWLVFSLFCRLVCVVYCLLRVLVFVRCRCCAFTSHCWRLVSRWRLVRGVLVFGVSWLLLCCVMIVVCYVLFVRDSFVVALIVAR